ncbi:MAG TPA: membrane protein insertase YidC, partial [Planctomycetaceae bacterium]
MDQRRFILFIVLSMAILIGWNAFVVPRLRPPPPKPAPQVAQGDKAADKAVGDDKAADKKTEVGPGKPEDEAAGEEKPGDAKPGDEKPGDENAQVAVKKPEADNAPEPVKPARELPDFPDKTVELGTILYEKDKGFRQSVTLTSRGAAVKNIALNDPRYVTLEKPHPALTVIGDDLAPKVPGTLEMAVPQLGADLRKLNWELVEVLPQIGPHSTALFRIRLDDIEVEKRYELSEVAPQATNPEAGAYALKVDFTFRNRGKEEKIVNYVLQGPTGLPLENIENTQKFRDVVVGFATKQGGVDHELLAGKTIAEGKVEEWKRPMKFIGVDVQFFAALLSPDGDQSTSPYTRSATQQVVGPVLKDKLERSDISVELTSVELTLAPMKVNGAKVDDETNAVTHTYHLFAGPKRDDVLPEGSAKVIDYGMFHWISRPMLGVLKFFYRIFGSWGIAIICLTI